MNNYIKIYSHPRSGTHFLEAFLAKNFYPEHELSSNGAIQYGHWSNKILLETGEPYHKLFGSHFFPEDSPMAPKMIYIYRDGRAVIASIWNSKFYNKNWEGISFSEFLRKDIDWFGGPGQVKDAKINIVQHWYRHTQKWLDITNPNLLFVRYEDLKNNPHTVYLRICKKFFSFRYAKEKVFGKKEVDTISKKVGLAPNKASIDSWNNLFSEEDIKFFDSQIPSRDLLYEAN